ncbi:MAG: protein-disulfide reductase DsbD domain-containing protein [Pseudomonadota bacterium]
MSAEPAIPTATQQAEYNGNSRFGTTGSSVFAASPARSILAPATSEPLASEWQRGFHSRVRLTAATLLDARGAPALFAGIDIRMDEGWKTYWQSPGDGGGIPPEFDWSRSQNVRALTVRYPAPQRLKDAYGTSIGYITQVLFPVEVIPLDPARPVRLRLAMHFGVCDDICIPAEATLALDVAPGARASVPVQRALSEALAAVPEAVALEALAVSLQNDAGGRHLMVTLGAEAPAVIGDLFARAPGGISLPVPKRIETPVGDRRWRIDLGHAGAAAKIVGAPVDFTLVGGQRGWLTRRTISGD